MPAPFATRPPKVGRWSEPALRVLRERYLAREGEEVSETPEDMCWRVARAIAVAEERSAAAPRQRGGRRGVLRRNGGGVLPARIRPR